MQGDHRQDKAVLLEVPGTRQPLLRVHVLGALRAVTHLGEDILPRGKKARATLGYLCINAGQRVARAKIASLLWERVGDTAARASLRQSLREIMQAMGGLADELVTADLDTIRLESRLCWIDAIEMLSSDSPLSLDAVRGDPTSIYTGELLEDLTGITPSFDEWLLGERSRFTARLGQMFERELAELGDARVEQRAALARRVIFFDPAHEGASRILMRALSDMGERPQALREYERCRTALRTIFDVEPSKETKALYQALKMFAGSEVAPPNLETPAKAPPGEERQSAPANGRLRVGVLPLHGGNSPHGESLAFLGQGIADGLSRFRWFDVLAPVSFPRGSSIASLRRRHVHYVVDGEIAGDEQKVRINVRLLDIAQDAKPVWNDRFELAATELAQLSEQVTGRIVGRIEPIIQFSEGQQTKALRSGATGLVLQAAPLMYSLKREKYEEAGRLISQAMEADPQNAKAAAWAAYWQVWYVGQGWGHDVSRGFASAHELALRAIRLDPENAEALGIYAHVCAFLDKNFDSAIHYYDRALRQNPNLAFIWALSAPTYCYIGEPEEALRRLDHYRDLAPFDPFFGYWEVLYTIAYTFKGDYEKAVVVGKRNVAANPEFTNAYKPLIAALGQLGRKEEAAPYVAKLLELEPHFTAEYFGKVYPIRRPEDRERYMRGLVAAGIPAA